MMGWWWWWGGGGGSSVHNVDISLRMDQCKGYVISVQSDNKLLFLLPLHVN